MAQITITIPDGVLARVLDGIAINCGYDGQQDGTKAQFAKKIVTEFIKGNIKASESRVAIADAHNKVDTEILIT